MSICQREPRGGVQLRTRRKEDAILHRVCLCATLSKVQSRDTASFGVTSRPTDLLHHGAHSCNVVGATHSWMFTDTVCGVRFGQGRHPSVAYKERTWRGVGGNPSRTSCWSGATPLCSASSCLNASTLRSLRIPAHDGPVRYKPAW